MQALDDDHAVPRVDAPGAGGLLHSKIEHRCVTYAGLVQVFQAGVELF